MVTSELGGFSSCSKLVYKFIYFSVGFSDSSISFIGDCGALGDSERDTFC